MIDIPVQIIGFLGSIAAVTFTTGDDVNDHDFTNTGNEILWVQNDGAGTVLVTVVSVADPFGRTGDVAFTVAATTGRGIAGPFVPTLFNQTNGKVNVLLDDDTGVTLAVIRYDPRKRIA